MKAVFILVEPSVGGNIGASARAIKVMGFDELWLINPVSYLEGEAKWLAHGAYDILQQARTFKSLSEAHKELDFLIGTSAKKRRVKTDYISAEDIPSQIVLKSESVQTFGVVFGRENSGLTNEEAQMCDWFSYLTMQTTYPSLNLSQAVMIYAYILSKHKKSWEKSEHPVSHEGFRKIKIRLYDTLKMIGFSDHHPILPRILERASQLSDKDLNLLQSVINKLRKRLDS